MNQTLYLKYRPQDFDSVIGQEITRITLKNASKEGKLSHAYLFTGPRGTGKTSMARIVAKALNCTNLKPDGNPCNECSICKAITDGRMVDIIEIDAASHTGVDDVRDLIDKARFMPNEAKRKVYIIDEVHQLSKPAFNALLKTLEEPPDHVHFILATTEGYKVPETIISRCQKFDFKRIEIKDIVYRLKDIAEKEGVEADIKALNLIAKLSEGGLRNAIGIFEKVVHDKQITYDVVVDHLDIAGGHIMESLYEDIENKRLKQAVMKINDVYESGASLTQFTKDFVEFLREKLLDTIAGDLQSESYVLLHRLDLLEKASMDLKNAVIPQLPLEIAVTRMCLTEEEPHMVVEKKTDAKEDKKKDKKEELKEEKTETKKPVGKKKEKEEETVIAPIPFSLDTIREHWMEICDQLSARLKHAAKNALPIRIEEETTVVLGVRSKTYLEMIKEHKARLELETILQNMFGLVLTVKAELEKIEPLTSDQSLSSTAGEVLSPEDAAQLLGGSIVDA
jgi:DNA polymerase-3 subunit gamma/tau